MRYARIAALACSLALISGVGASAAPAPIQPIVIREAKDHPGCQIYLKADGSRLLYKGAPIAAGGSCPADFLRGKVTRFGANSYKLQVPGATCIINPSGFGECR